MSSLSRLFSIGIVLILLSSMVALAQPEIVVPTWREPLPVARTRAEIVVGKTTVPVELAVTSRAQSLGLGYRNELDPDSGMLFVFAGSGLHTFWMMGMRFCLDIVWIEGGVIVGAAESACPPPAGTPSSEYPLYPSMIPVTYVLEMNAGWLKNHGYGVGTPVKIPAALQ